MTRALALVAAMAFALLPGVVPPAMAMADIAPPGFIAVCTAEGVAYVPAGDSLPPDAVPGAGHAGQCLHCCPAQIAALTLDPSTPAMACRWALAFWAPPHIGETAKPAESAFPRGPPVT